MFLHHPTTIPALIIFLTTLPSLPAQPTSPTSPLHLRNPRCHDIPQPLRAPLETMDCITALGMLPSSTAIGTFSLHAPIDAQQFRLPRHFAHGSCMIGVTMATTGVIGDEDTTSWNRIGLEVVGIVRECVQQPVQPRDKVGGSDNVGTRGKIQLDVLHNQQYLRFMVDLNKPPPAEPVVASSAASKS